MEEARNLPLLSQYSDAFTRLHEGKLTCMEFGMQRLPLNRFVVDSARSTSKVDAAPLLAMVDPEKVEGYDESDDKMEFCAGKLQELVTLQEEVNTLHKVAREKGISGGLLNIVGQAAIQSPADHGASVIHQLNAIMSGADETNSASIPAKKPTDDSTKVTIESQGDVAILTAANDPDDVLGDDGGSVLEVIRVLQSNWQAVAVDVSVCAVASFFAISLVS